MRQLQHRLIDLPRMRHAAMRYGRHDWPVTPGARLHNGRFVCDRAGCPTLTCHPAIEQWQASASADRRQIAHWWRQQPRTVLIATGGTVDVLDVPAYLGLWVLKLAHVHNQVLGPRRRQLRGPLALTPTGRWMFFVQPGTHLRPELAEHPDVLLHGAGSWVPAPPTRMLEGPVRWSVSPSEVHWRLPDALAVQALVADALTATPTIAMRPPRAIRAALAS